MEYAGTSLGAVHSSNETDQTSLMPSLNLYGSFQLGQTQYVDANLTATYTNNDYMRRYAENNYRFYTKADEDLYTIDFSANYDRQLKHNNSFGLNLSHLHVVSSSSYQGSINHWSHLWTAETVLLAQYSQSLGKVYLSLQFGGDLLQYRLHGKDAERYLSPHANVMLNYRIKPGHALMYGLNTGNSNPPMEWLSNVDQDIDSLSVKRGNPYLDKTDYYVSFLVYTFQKGKINLQVAGQYFGAINNVSTDYYVEGDRMISSFRSDGNYHQLRGSVSVTWKIRPDFHVKLSGFYRYNKITGKVEVDWNEWGGSADMNYYWKDFAFNLHGKSTGRTLENVPAFIDTPATYGAFIRWTHNGWMAEAGTDNTFSTRNRHVKYMDMGVFRFHHSSYSKTYQKTGYVKLAYTFDFGKKTSKEKRDVNATINSAILKAG